MKSAQMTILQGVLFLPSHIRDSKRYSNDENHSNSNEWKEDRAIDFKTSGCTSATHTYWKLLQNGFFFIDFCVNRLLHKMQRLKERYPSKMPFRTTFKNKASIEHGGQLKEIIFYH